MLSGVDDGATDDAEMCRMLEMSYADGIRGICFTPHFQYAFYGDNRRASEQAFARAKKYAEEHLPGLSLYLGNELFFHADALEYLMDGSCRTLNGGRYVLTDFDSEVPLGQIKSAVSQLISRGYIPVLAHVERYSCFGRDIRPIGEFRRQGCVIQVNASSFDGEWGRDAQRRAKKLLSHAVVHVIASDAHHADFRAPGLSACAYRVAEKYGEAYARELFYENPLRLMQNERLPG